MKEIDRIAKALDDADIPKEVWIGTDSTADRVTWLIIRNRLNQQNSRSRFKAMNVLADLVEAALTTGIDDNWRTNVDEALMLAGRRQS